MSGTSMATPHVAGVVALMLEANPNLTPAQVKDILERTAANMTGRLPWEVGAGHLNAYAATLEAAGVRTGYGATVNMLRQFNSNAVLLPGGAATPFSVFFSPVGTVEEHSFEIGADVAYVNTKADIGSNTLALVLTDPDGVRYGSAISLPVLGSTVTTGAPGKAGTWKVSVRGIGSVSGVGLDPGGVTNGYGLPGTVSGTIETLRSGSFVGLSDIGGHAARQAIEFAVAHRLVDGYADGRFRPDAVLKRGELAQYLVMGGSVRQALPAAGQRSFNDVAGSSAVFPYAEAAIARGAPLRNLDYSHDGVMGLVNGAFNPNGGVTRISLAYSLVQALGLQPQARAFDGELTAFYDGKRVPVVDAASIPASLRGYAQFALDQGVLNARFATQQGPFDLQPTLVAYFDPSTQVTRAAFAVAASRYQPVFRGSSD